MSTMGREILSALRRQRDDMERKRNRALHAEIGALTIQAQLNYIDLGAMYEVKIDSFNEKIATLERAIYESTKTK